MGKKVLLRIPGWGIPILLVASSYGWAWPPTGPYREVIDPTLREVCQITGLLCSLSLGPWSLFVFAHICSFWARASLGTFGMSLAGYILLGMDQNASQVFYACAVLQAAWLLFMLWYQSQDDVILQATSLCKQLLQEMEPLFGPRYVACYRRLKPLSTFLLFVFAVSLGWLIFTHGSQQYEAASIYLKWITLPSLGLLILLVPPILAITKTTSVLISRSARDSLKGVACELCLIGFVFSAAVVGKSVQILGYVHPDESLTWLDGLAPLALLLFWVFASWWWYKYALGLESAIENSSDLQNIRRKCLYCQNEPSFFRERSFNTEVTSTERGLTFNDINGERVIVWDQVKNIIFGAAGIVSVIDQDGKKFDARMPSQTKKPVRSKPEIEAIWAQWADHIARKEAITEFEYPAAARERDRKEYRSTGWTFIGYGIMIPIVMTLAILKRGDISVVIPVFTSLGSLGAFLGGIYMVTREPKQLLGISISDNSILLRYTADETKEICADDIKDSLLVSDRSGVSAAYKGLPIQEHIEQVDYWPILMEYLESKIETNKKS